MTPSPRVGRIVYIDGVAHAPADAKVSVYDRGFLYGDSVFETLRTYAGEPFALREHIDRLRNSAALVGMELPIAPEALASEVERAIAEAGNDESMVRVIVSRGQGPLGLDPALADAPLRVVLVEPLVMPPVGVYRDGLRAVCVQTVRASDAAQGAKLSNYLASALAHSEARAKGAEEALIVNRDGQVVEGTTANLFAVRGSVLETPALEAGILAGITRAMLLGVAPGEGLEVRFTTWTPAELAVADEVFLSSTVREVIPLVAIDGHVVGGGRPGSATRRLHAAFRAHVGLGELRPLWERAEGADRPQRA